MVDINKPFTKEDLETFCEQIKSIPKTPSRVRVGLWLGYVIEKEATILKESDRQREYDFVKSLSTIPVILDDKLDPFKYEVDYFKEESDV